MVSAKISQRASVVHDWFWGDFTIFLVLVIYTCCLATPIMLFGEKLLPTDPAVGDTVVLPEIDPNEESSDSRGEQTTQDDALDSPQLVYRVNFQPLIDDWSSSVSGKKGIIVYDLDLSTVVGEYDADVKFATASLYKLFVVYEGYRRLQSGIWSPETMVGRTGYNISQCLDLAIRESHSPCAETLWSMIGHSELDDIVKGEFNIDLDGVGSLSATPRQIMQMMRLYYEHNEIQNPDLVQQMSDSFLNQPATTYDWRMGLPSGFSSQVKVYNKVGWDYANGQWAVFDDVAIVSFDDCDRNFVVVVMTSGVRTQQIADFGRRFEKTFLNEYSCTAARSAASDD